MNREKPKRKHRISNCCPCLIIFSANRTPIGATRVKTQSGWMARARREMSCDRWKRMPDLAMNGRLRLPRRPELLGPQGPESESVVPDRKAAACWRPAVGASFGAALFLAGSAPLRDMTQEPNWRTRRWSGGWPWPVTQRPLQPSHPVCSFGSRNPSAVAIGDRYKRTDKYETRNVDQCGAVRRSPHCDC
jgi:hypothetical protein